MNAAVNGLSETARGTKLPLFCEVTTGVDEFMALLFMRIALARTGSLSVCVRARFIRAVNELFRC